MWHIFPSLLFSLLFPYFVGRVDSVWTENDESQRIAMIMAEEKKLFDEEMRRQQWGRSRSEVGSTFSQERKGLSGLSVSSSSHDRTETLRTAISSDISEENWCYHCTSPISHLSSNMKKTIKDFLKIRRTSYPTKVATPECVSARNFSLLHKQSCKHRYCQTLALVDHKEGASFVLRGCAENFGAINSKILDVQPENTCTKLHDKLDISECICRERKYCYANSRSSARTKVQLISILLVLSSLV